MDTKRNGQSGSPNRRKRSPGKKCFIGENTPNRSKPKTSKISKVTKTHSPIIPSSRKRESDRQVQTPYSLRTKIKQRLGKMVSNDYEDEDCLSSDESNDSEVDDTSEPTTSVTLERTKTTKRPKAKAEDYFRAREGGVKTSNHTLSRLEMPQFSHATLHEVLQKIPAVHKMECECLMAEHRKKFSKWIFQLSEGYNLLLYGLGSKISLLQEFRASLVDDYTVLVINGFFPSITLKQILNSITEEVLDHVGDFMRPEDQATFIRQSLEESDLGKLVIIISSIDGVMLRNERVQNTLCYLAQSEMIHIVASIDHINAPLLWDQAKMSCYNWIWCDVTTFLPYTEETSYENSLLVQQTGSLALSSLTYVFRSLTPNAKGIFLLLAQYHLGQENKTNKSTGMSFQECYQQCREAFLVNSELTLRAQLTEFKDHMLLKIKKGSDGSEILHIPLDNVTISEFLQQHGQFHLNAQ